MKTVVNIIHQQDGSVTSEICQVPDDYIQCSVSGTWVPKSEMCDSDGNMVRTNSLWTYNMSGGMNLIRAATIDHRMTPQYRALLVEVESIKQAQENSVPIQELIDSLLELQRVKPNARVCVTQDGYYADGGYGWVNTNPEQVYEDVYSIGHSSQNY
jgi:hypothetical protein